MAVDEQPRAGRDVSVDVARGLAIVLIVLGHVVRGLSASGNVDPSRPWYDELDSALYLLHLPVFVLISGAFVARAATRDGAAAYLRNRLTLLAYLFVLWTLLQGAVQVAASRLTNLPTRPGDVVAGIWHPLGQLWFLPTLAALTVVTVLIAPWRSAARLGAFLTLSTVVSLAAWGHFGSWSGTQGMGLAATWAAGVVLGDRRLLEVLRSRALVPAGLVAGVAFAVLLVVTDPTNPSDPVLPPTVAGVAYGVLAVALSLVAFLAAARVVARTGAAGSAAFLGRHSLEIFLAHVTASSGCRIVLVRLGLTDVWTLAVAGVLVGLFGSLVLVLLARRTPLRLLFTPPATLLPRQSSAAVTTAVAL